MAFCTKCGLPVDDDALFCSSCGAPIGSSDSSISSDPYFMTPGVDDLASSSARDERKPLGKSVSSSTSDSSSVDDIPMFTPPDNDIPIFTPPNGSHRTFSGPACHHHPNEPAVDRCARCGHYVCQDCAEAYTVSGGEYANQVLCYDCCQEIVSENVELLKKQKSSIMTTFIITIIGMFIGWALFSESGSTWAMLFGMLWIGSFWTWVKSSISGWWHAPGGPSIAGFIGSCLGAAIVAPIITTRKIIECIIYLRKTANSIKEDSECLRQMREYMEYTKVISRNEGVDLDYLMRPGSELSNNSYAQVVHSQGEKAADAMMRRCATTIAENGEIIRSFAA